MSANQDRKARDEVSTQVNKSPATRRANTPRHGVARVISKLGLGSRTEAARWIQQGRVSVNGRTVRDPEKPVRQGVDRIEIDGKSPTAAPLLVLMMNKPRGLVTTTSDERNRDTVYCCFEGAELPWLAPIGRLDKASEGLLLFCNDPVWAARITSPDEGPDKTYHVQIDRPVDSQMLAALRGGAMLGSERLMAKSISQLRSGTKTAWLEVVLSEGRNRHIRRLMSAFAVSVLRLVRVAIGPLTLGELAKGKWRILTPEEVRSLQPTRAK